MNWKRALGILRLLICLSGLASGYGGTSNEPLLLLGGKQLSVSVQPFQKGDNVFIWVRELERAGLGKVDWDPETQVVTVTTPMARLAFRPGEEQAKVWISGESSAGGVEQSMPCASVWEDGHVMVPLGFVCEMLGVGYRLETRLVVFISQPAELSAVDHPTPGARGGIEGRVFFGPKPAANVVLRLVRASDFSFLPDRKATTDQEGRYEFRGVEPGDYDVYAYVGDNREYFNRYTAAIKVESEATSAPDMHLGMILRPLAPAIGDWVIPSDVVLSWTACEVAQLYIVSVVDSETGEEVFAKQVTGSGDLQSQPPNQTVVPRSRLESFHDYQWSVIATDREGQYVGGSPGSGLPQWTFSVADAGDAFQTMRSSRGE